jgi:hypothetical protein
MFSSGITATVSMAWALISLYRRYAYTKAEMAESRSHNSFPITIFTVESPHNASCNYIIIITK